MDFGCFEGLRIIDCCGDDDDDDDVAAFPPDVLLLWISLSLDDDDDDAAAGVLDLNAWASCDRLCLVAVPIVFSAFMIPRSTGSLE